MTGGISACSGTGKEEKPQITSMFFYYLIPYCKLIVRLFFVWEMKMRKNTGTNDDEGKFNTNISAFSHCGA